MSEAAGYLVIDIQTQAHLSPVAQASFCNKQDKAQS